MTGFEISGLVVRRGGRQVLHGVDVSVPPGQVVALLGANGAGKSTVVLTAAGVLRAARGQVTVDGVRLTGRRPERVRAAGVAVVPEGHRVLAELTVRDNLRVAAVRLRRRAIATGIASALDTFPELVPLLDRPAGTLSGGQQQMLVIAQALVDRPRYLLVDELSLGLAPVVVARLVPVLRELAGIGTGVLLIEQFAHVALSVAAQAYVLDRGRIAFSGTASELSDRPDLLHEVYLGTAQ